MVSGIVEINRQRCFSLEEAEALLPIIYRLTDESSREMRRLVQCLETLPDKKSSRALEIEAQVDLLIDRWQKKLSRLGAHPKGLWLADFDNGDGYWCWKFPETSIRHYHGYQDGFTGRKQIATNMKDMSERHHENRHRADQSHPWGFQGE
ncbi:MAG TPA: DUF2203 domain-containing protein [Pseudobdellovibrionaceae bacterium]|nr:DUF2203 domain-containing protein [Pseudobdellovibrionaceae bacterium]